MTQKTYSLNPLEEIDYYPRYDGLADVRIRENIRKVDHVGEFGDGTEFDETEWEADETYLVTDMTLEQVQANKQHLLDSNKDTYAARVMLADMPRADGPTVGD